MPLQNTKPRQAMHRRNVNCEGYLRDDELWDIEAHLVDTRTYDCGYDADHRDAIKAGDAVHDMWLRITIDLDFLIHEVDSVSDQTPFGICTSAPQSMQQLIGLTIGPGWMKLVRERIGSEVSCTHMMGLLPLISATAYQTMHSALNERYQAKAKAQTNLQKPMIIDTCLALSSEGEVVKNRWPAFYTGPDSTTN